MRSFIAFLIGVAVIVVYGGELLAIWAVSARLGEVMLGLVGLALCLLASGPAQAWYRARRP
jgi:hypothetical protein